jgi:polyisoprenoid-binding protein YceI
MTTIIEEPTVKETLTGTYSIDTAHSRLGFVARHVMITKVRGAFNDFSGTAVIDAEQPENSTIEITIQAGSIDTSNEMRDGHLKSNDFLAMEEFPQITFKSTGIKLVSGDVATAGEARFLVSGGLTIKGVTNSVDIDLTYTGSAVDPYGNHRIGFEGKTTIKRSEWGITWNGALEAGGVLVSEEIALEFDISAIKAS